MRRCSYRSRPGSRSNGPSRRSATSPRFRRTGLRAPVPLILTIRLTPLIPPVRPDPLDRTMRTVPVEEHQHVIRAGVLLRLAVALNQDRASDVLKVTLRVYPKRVLMELSPGRTGAELELWSLRKEADYFREVFRRELFAALA